MQNALNIELNEKKLELTSFELEFKDGIVIYLASQTKDEITEWMKKIEEVEEALFHRPLPEWLKV
jgi:hypothetical protein